MPACAHICKRAMLHAHKRLYKTCNSAIKVGASAEADKGPNCKRATVKMLFSAFITGTERKHQHSAHANTNFKYICARVYAYVYIQLLINLIYEHNVV